MKIVKVLSIIFIISIIFSVNSEAQYLYNFESIVLELSRDTNLPNCIVEYSSKEKTNDDVTVTISSDKEIEAISGFGISDDKKVLTKIVSENESQKLKIKDLSGNFTEIEYNVDNIDKEKPKILGCENGGTYTDSVELEYSDNDEIEEIYIDRYDDLIDFKSYESTSNYHKINSENYSIGIEIFKHPLNTKKYILYLNDMFYTTTMEDYFIFSNLKEGNYLIKVVAVDELGNILDSVEKSMEASKNLFNKIEENVQENINILTENGKYQIKVKDMSGNEENYYIEINKKNY